MHDETSAMGANGGNEVREVIANKVQVDSSPFLYAFYNSHVVHIVIDTGATSSLVSAAFLRRSGIVVKPTSHSARAVNKSPLSVSGEVQISLQFGDLSLPITALVVELLDYNILTGK